MQNRRNTRTTTTTSADLVCPVSASVWLIHCLYTSTGLVLICSKVSSTTLVTSGFNNSRSAPWPRAFLSHHTYKHTLAMSGNQTELSLHSTSIAVSIIKRAIRSGLRADSIALSHARLCPATPSSPLSMYAHLRGSKITLHKKRLIAATVTCLVKLLIKLSCNCKIHALTTV